MTREIARKSAAAAGALGALMSAARAEPVVLTDAQLEQVTAGAFEYDAASNLYDVYGIAYTYDPATGLYRDDYWGHTWEAPSGIFYNSANAAAYGYLWDGAVAWDGGFVTLEP